MARKNRNLASFDQVANDNVNEKINVNNNENVSDNINESIKANDNTKVNENVKNNDEFDDVLDNLVAKEKTHILKGIYFENEVAKAIDRIAKGKGRGAKSEIVNAAVKKVFKEKGWL